MAASPLRGWWRGCGVRGLEMTTARDWLTIDKLGACLTMH